MKYIKVFLIFSILCYIVGCTTEKPANYSEDNVEYVDKGNKSYSLSNEFGLLSNSNNVAESSVPFTLVKAFVPDQKYTEYFNVKDQEVMYIKLNSNQTKLSGNLIIENNREEDLHFQTLFFQGNETAQVKPKNSKDWSNSLKFNVPQKKALEVSIDIKWDMEGEQELTFVPLETNGERKDGHFNITNYRFFVQSKEINIKNSLLEEQSFHFNKENIDSDINFRPHASWYSKEKQMTQFINEKEKTYSIQPIEGIMLEAVPYNSYVDVLLFSEYGNSKIIKERVPIKKNLKTYIPLPKKVKEDMNNSEIRQFVRILNNRGVEILADWKTLDIDKKPFFTSYQGILEYHDLLK